MSTAVVFNAPSIIFVVIICCRLSLSVDCEDNYCFQVCIENEGDHAACINREINFEDATAGSVLICRGDNTCKNITLRCPLNATADASQDRYNCEIRGKYTLHNQYPFMNQWYCFSI